MSPLALMAARITSAASKRTFAIHQNTSAGAGYRSSLEGWSRAGIKNVELTNKLLDDFLKTNSLAAARQVLMDFGCNEIHRQSGFYKSWEFSSDARPANRIAKA